MRKINKHKIALKRKEILDKAEKLKEKGIKYKEMEEILNVNERTLRRWKKAYNELGIRGLEPQSTRPNRLVTKRILTDKMLRLIEQTRKENLFYGKRKLQEILLRKGYDLKLSTIGNGLNILMKQGRILPVYILSCTKERKRIRKFNKCYAQRLPFGHQTQIQIDHMVLNIKGKEIRQFSAYSKKDKLLVTQVYENATSQTAAKFLTEEVLQGFPFNIKEVQVDGGSEFMGDFERACQDNNIKLLVLPPRKPKINGNVCTASHNFHGAFFIIGAAFYDRMLHMRRPCYSTHCSDQQSQAPVERSVKKNKKYCLNYDAAYHCPDPQSH